MCHDNYANIEFELHLLLFELVQILFESCSASSSLQEGHTKLSSKSYIRSRKLNLYSTERSYGWVETLWSILHSL